ncbi:MAG: hypothetical protein KAY32_08555 [Candidatus Eisenbacteria sp.]|nr:hypothetical protein [Candidatus Eisenbacteria bacterium]
MMRILFSVLATGLVASCIAGPSTAEANLRLAWSAAGEQHRQLDADAPLTRSAFTGQARLVYDDGVHLQGACAFEWIADRALPERERLDLREGFLGIAYGPGELILGRQLLSWGRLDLLRPTDLFRRRDLHDPIENRHQPVWAARLILYRGRHSLEGVWIPRFEPDILSYDERNPWCLFPDSIGFGQLGPYPTDIREGERREPGGGIGSSEFALRWDARMGTTDLGVVAIQGYDPVPTWFAATSAWLRPDGTLEMTIDAVHRPITLLGIDSARPLGRGTLRGELARTWTSPSPGGHEEPDYLRAGIGIDQTFGQVVAGRDLFLLAQYNYDEGYREPTGFTGYQHFYKHAGLIRLRLRPGRHTAIEVETYRNWDDRDRYLKLELRHSPQDGWDLLIGALLVGGARGSFLGQFRDNDRLRVMIRYQGSHRLR